MGNQHSVASSPSTWHEGRFTSSELERIQRRLTRIGRGSPEVAACDLRNMVPDNPFIDSIFEFYDTDQDGLLGHRDVQNLLRDVAAALASHDKHKQLRFAFQIFDTNRDGLLDRAEMIKVLQSSKGKEFSRDISSDELCTIVDALFRSVSAEKGLTFEEFKTLFVQAS